MLLETCLLPLVLGSSRRAKVPPPLPSAMAEDLSEQEGAEADPPGCAERPEAGPPAAGEGEAGPTASEASAGEGSVAGGPPSEQPGDPDDGDGLTLDPTGSSLQEAGGEPLAPTEACVPDGASSELGEAASVGEPGEVSFPAAPLADQEGAPAIQAADSDHAESWATIGQSAAEVSEVRRQLEDLQVELARNHPEAAVEASAAAAAAILAAAAAELRQPPLTQLTTEPAPAEAAPASTPASDGVAEVPAAGVAEVPPAAVAPEPAPGEKISLADARDVLRRMAAGAARGSSRGPRPRGPGEAPPAAEGLASAQPGNLPGDGDAASFAVSSVKGRGEDADRWSSASSSVWGSSSLLRPSYNII